MVERSGLDSHKVSLRFEGNPQEFLNYFYRERPAAISVNVKSFDDTSNFDDFPEVDLPIPVTSNTVTGQPYKDWAFLNYTYKRFEGMSETMNRKLSKKSLFDMMEVTAESQYQSQ